MKSSLKKTKACFHCHKEESQQVKLRSSSNHRYISEALVRYIRKCPGFVDRWRNFYVCELCIVFFSRKRDNELPSVPNKPANTSNIATEPTPESSIPAARATIPDSFSENDGDHFQLMDLENVSKIRSVEDLAGVVVQFIEKDYFRDIDLKRILVSMGKRVRKEFLKDTSKGATVSFENLLSYEKIWEREKHPLHFSYLSGICNPRTADTRKQEVCRYLVKSTELVNAAIKKNFISSNAVAENLLLLALTNSKLGSDLFGKATAGGSYKSVQRLKSTLAQKEELPATDVVIAFDNNQVIGKTHAVSANSKQKVSTVTSMVAFSQVAGSKYQFHFSPPTTIHPGLEQEKLLQLYIQFSKTADAVYTNYRNASFQTFMRKSDAAETATPRVNRLDAYSGVTSKIKKVVALDLPCLMINPNSYERVKQVLDCILKEAGQRKWILVFCDGLPYGLAVRAIQEEFLCTTCKAKGKEKSLLETKNHLDCNNRKLERMYKKIILRPGPLHIEINLVRSIFSIFWELYIQPVVKSFGITHVNSLEYYKCATDHHKSWSILKIVYKALGDSIVDLYMTTRKTEESQGNPEEFQTFLNNVNSPNLTMAAHFVFGILHPLFLYRSAIRNGNDDIARIALHKAAVVFFGSNHPKYQTLYARDLLYQLKVAEYAGAEFILTNGGSWLSSLFSQGFDALNEERNKLLKGWCVYQGVPSNEQWAAASLSLNAFLRAKDIIASNLGMPKTLPDIKTSSYTNEIAVARKLFTNHFEKHINHPVLCDTDGKCSEFMNQLSQFYGVAKSNRDAFIKSFIAGKACKLSYVVTPKLGKDVYNSMMCKIRKDILLLNEALRDNYSSELDAASGVEDLELISLSVMQDIEALHQSLFSDDIDECTDTLDAVVI